jgi:4'-phosphopantetheinyl transferase
VRHHRHDPRGDGAWTPLPPRAAHVWLLPTAEQRDGALVTSDDERARAARFLHAERRREWLSSRDLLRHALSRHAPVAPDAWRFAADPRGRPYVASPRISPELHFSVSHAQGAVCCLVAREPLLGVDVEPCDRDAPFMLLARRHFTPGEVRALEELDEPLRRDRFLERWTLGEALLKACGVGLTTRLDAFAFARDTASGAVRVVGEPDCALRGATRGGWQLETFVVAARWRVSLALRLRRAGPFRVVLCGAGVAQNA